MVGDLLLDAAQGDEGGLSWVATFDWTRHTGIRCLGVIGVAVREAFEPGVVRHLLTVTSRLATVTCHVRAVLTVIVQVVCQ